MALNSILKKGSSYRVRVIVKDQNGDPADLDLIPNLVIVAYSKKNNTVLKKFNKVDMTIDDPSTGLAVIEFTGSETQVAESELYILEYKYKTDSEEIPEKGYWGTFVDMKTKTEHFA